MKAQVRTTIVTTIDVAEMKVLGHDLHVETDDELPEPIVLAISQGALTSGLKKIYETRTTEPLEESIYGALLDEFQDEDEAARAVAVVEKYL